MAHRPSKQLGYCALCLRWDGEVRFADAVLVEFKVRGEELADGDGVVFIEHEFQLETLALHAVVAHEGQGVLVSAGTLSAVAGGITPSGFGTV